MFTILSSLLTICLAVVSAQPARQAQPAINQALRAELLEMEKLDQQARRAMMDGTPNERQIAEIEAVDKKHSARLREIVRQYGWPDKKLAGEDGAHAAWLLVQHADRDPEFQRQCLPLLQEAAARGEVSKRDLAYLIDRVRVNSGQWQLYGTQAWWDSRGTARPRPIENEAEVDRRRAEMGLEPLAEYMKVFPQVYSSIKAVETQSYRTSDVSSVDALVAALYDVISGPAGQKREWDRMRSLFVPGAKMMPIVPEKNGGFAVRQLSVEDYVTRAGLRLESEGFFEREIARRTERFGNLVHVFSTYESRHKPEDKAPFARGINSLQLMYDGKRWWILSIAWESERPDNPIPKESLPK